MFVVNALYSLSSRFTSQKPQGDIIQELIGAWGPYQFRLCFYIFLSKFFIAFNQLIIIFLAPKVVYTCADTEEASCPCSEPVYDKSVFTETIIMKWNLICDKSKGGSFNQGAFQFGTLVGSVIFGMASDRCGRKLPLLVAVIIQVVAGVASAFVPNYWFFTTLRMIVGISVGGTMVIGFVIIMEFVGTQHREVLSALYQVPFNMGHMLLPLIAYKWRNYWQMILAISLPGLILLSYFCLVPETARWLIAVKRTEEAIVILERVAKANGRPTDTVRAAVARYQAELERNKLKKGNIIDLFRTPNIRKNILASALNWVSCSYCFYGVSQLMGQLSGDIFLNVLASATVTLLGTLFSIPIMKVIGRKAILIIFNFICAGCLFVLAAYPEGTVAVVCACIGVVSSFICFVLVYLYTSELFPTVVRNAAIGVSSMLARVGSMLAPFVLDLKDKARWAPPVVFAIVPLVTALATFVLPETKGCKLMTTIEEGEQFGKTPRDPNRPNA